MSIEVGGHVEPGFEGVRDAFANNFEEHGEVGRELRVLRRGHQGRRPLGRCPHRHRRRRTTTTRCRSCSRRPRAPPPRARTCSRERGLLDVDAPGRHVLARVRPGGQGAHPGAVVAQPPGRVADGRRQADARRGAGVGAGDPRARGAGAALGAGRRARLPRAHVRTTSSARSSAASTGAASARSSTRSSPSRSGSSSGSGCPRSSSHAWRR